uniref:Uncharacterized protein n=1 Tax=Ditylenchus dipsaci TaxID=166011 RepID=A0A915D4N2_9BILA
MFLNNKLWLKTTRKALGTGKLWSATQLPPPAPGRVHRDFITVVRKYDDGQENGNAFTKNSLRHTIPHLVQRFTTNTASKCQNGKSSNGNAPATAKTLGPEKSDKVRSFFDRLARPKHVVASVFQRNKQMGDNRLVR